MPRAALSVAGSVRYVQTKNSLPPALNKIHLIDRHIHTHTDIEKDRERKAPLGAYITVQSHRHHTQRTLSSFHSIINALAIFFFLSAHILLLAHIFLSLLQCRNPTLLALNNNWMESAALGCQRQSSTYSSLNCLVEWEKRVGRSLKRIAWQARTILLKAFKLPNWRHCI